MGATEVVFFWGGHVSRQNAPVGGHLASSGGCVSSGAVFQEISLAKLPTTSFLAVIGAAGLAVGLALRDSLSNFAAGVMLVLFRPFKVGDFVDTAGISGSVKSISIFNTVLKTPDNRVITVPNGLIYADTITNYSAEEKRRIDLVIGISYNDDIGRAKALIQGVLMQESRLF